MFKASQGERPYVYFESRSYLYHARVPMTFSTTEACVPYVWDSNDDDQFSALDWDANGNGVLDISEETRPFANPKTFQIISAGVDSDFGPATNQVVLPRPSGSPLRIVGKVYPIGTGYGDPDNDNMTNFSERSLGDARP